MDECCSGSCVDNPKYPGEGICEEDDEEYQEEDDDEYDAGDYDDRKSKKMRCPKGMIYNAIVGKCKKCRGPRCRNSGTGGRGRVFPRGFPGGQGRFPGGFLWPGGQGRQGRFPGGFPRQGRDFEEDTEYIQDDAMRSWPVQEH